jgi:hypothetical protein
VSNQSKPKPQSRPSPESVIRESSKKIQDFWDETEKEETDPEWIILFGATRTGKSLGALDMFRYYYYYWCSKFGDGDPPVCYVINTDLSAQRDMKNYPDLVDMGIVKQRKCKTVEDVMLATYALVGSVSAGIPPKVKPHDFIIVDRATVVWEMFPDYYFRTRLGKTADQIEYEHQSSGENGKIKGGSATLQYYNRGINPLWQAWETSIRLSGAHCIFVCTEQELAKESTAVRERDSQEKISQFISVGHVPRMQGDTWSRWHTQLYLSRPYTKPEWFVRTVGDRGDRKWLEKTKIGRDLEDGLGKIYFGDVCGFEI